MRAEACIDEREGDCSEAEVAGVLSLDIRRNTCHTCLKHLPRSGVCAEARMDDSEGGCSDAEVAGVLSLDNRRGSGNGGAGAVAGGRGGTPGERVLKFELQMYKMRDGEYCIDIQARGAPNALPVASTGSEGCAPGGTVLVAHDDAQHGLV